MVAVHHNYANSILMTKDYINVVSDRLLFEFPRASNNQSDTLQISVDDYVISKEFFGFWVERLRFVHLVITKKEINLV